MKKIFVFTIILLGLSACTTFLSQAKTEPAATDTPLEAMPNPASVYCEQQGNKHKIATATEGSQSGVCIFPDGSSCDEWAYYRAECGPAVQTTPTPALTIETTSNSMDGNTGGSNPGSSMPPGATEEIADWWGVIKGTEPGAEFDDYFERQDLGGAIYFGIDSMDPAVRSQIEALRDSEKTVHLYGTLLSNVPDYNGSQVQVERIEVDE